MRLYTREERLTGAKIAERSRISEAISHASCPLCKTPICAVMTAKGPAWQCGCEELKKRKLLPAA